MKTLPGEHGVGTASEKIVSVISEMLNPNPDENPPPPGPWDPYIRRALGRFVSSFASRFGVQPIPWSMGPQPDPWIIMGDILSRVGLNPQPLPPRINFMISLAQDVLERAALIHEIATTLGEQGQKEGIIVVGGFVSRFVDEFCGTGFRLRLPIPGPRPPWWNEELSGLDLIVMGVQFAQTASEVSDKAFQEELQKASKRLNEAGMTRI